MPWVRGLRTCVGRKPGRVSLGSVFYYVWYICRRGALRIQAGSFDSDHIRLLLQGSKASSYLDLEKVLGRAVDLLKGLLPVVGHGLDDGSRHAGHAGHAAGRGRRL